MMAHDQTIEQNPSPKPPASATAPAPSPRAVAKVFYHCYFCPSRACLDAQNPTRGSVHQRGIHLASDQPQKDVKCPGCGGAMVIARNGLKRDKEGNAVPHEKGHITTGPDGNAILWGEPLIHEAPGQEDQSRDASLFVTEEN